MKRWTTQYKVYEILSTLFFFFLPFLEIKFSSQMYPRKAPHWILLKYISIFWTTNAKHTIQTNWEVLGRGWNGLLFFLFSILWPQSGIWILGYGGITRCSSITAPSKRGVVSRAFHYSHAANIQHPQPLISPTHSAGTHTHIALAWTIH